MQSAPSADNPTARNDVQIDTSDMKTPRFALDGCEMDMGRQGISSAQGDGNIRESVPGTTDKNIVTQQLLSASVTSNICFSQISEQQKQEIISMMYRVEVQVGDVIMSKDQLSTLYVVEHGLLVAIGCSCEDDNSELQIGPGAVLGELALMHDVPENYNITALEPSVLWGIDRFDYRRVLINSSEDKLKDYTSLLEQCPVLNTLSAEDRRRCAQAVEEVCFPPDHMIIKQGDIGEAFFVMLSGEAVCYVTHEVGAPPAEGKIYTMGEFFGERALITDHTRACSIITTTFVQCLKLDRVSFRLLLGPVYALLKEHISHYEERKPLPSTRRFSVMQRESIDMLHKSIPFELPELKVLSTLGKGSFGVVKLVEDPDGQQYALKVINKQKMLDSGHSAHIWNEKQVMELVDSPFAVNLKATWKDDKRLFFLVELCFGGELFFLIQQWGKIPEEAAKFYTACCVCAFEHLHQQQIAYRDMKPENLLLDKKGYLKIIDFGFSKVVEPDSRTYTLCGTPEYLAPEVISGTGHGLEVDLWGLGVLVFEMLAGYSPFASKKKVAKVYENILARRISFPESFSANAKDFIDKLMNLKPCLRLGAGFEGDAAIKEHPWFDGFDWEGLEAGTINAPYIMTTHDEAAYAVFRSNAIVDAESGYLSEEDDMLTYNGEQWYHGF